MFHLPRRRVAALSFPLAAITALALLLIGEVSYHRSMAALERTTQAFNVRLRIDQVLRLVVDAESGQRGYLLTGRPQYLQPFVAATQAIGKQLTTLATYYSQGEGKAQGAEFKTLARAVETKLSEMDVTVQARREGREEAWRGLMESDLGREAQERIRASAAKLAAAETARLDAHRARIGRTLMLSRLGVAAMTVLSLLAFYFYLRQARQLTTLRERQHAELEEERDTLDRKVRKRTAQLTELARYLQTTQENQRNLLARELHDELGALLTSAKLDVARLQSRLPAASGAEARERVAHLNQVLNSGIALKRRIIEDLRPSALANLGLVASLDILTREFAKTSGLAMTATLEPVTLSAEGELTAYRFVQEALTNVAKYAKARQVTVTLGPEGDNAMVSVRDDGQGFDTTAAPGGTHGLVGMRYRVEAEQGRMQIVSRPGDGSLLQAWLPCRPAPGEEPAGAPAAAASTPADGVQRTAAGSAAA